VVLRVPKLKQVQINYQSIIIPGSRVTGKINGDLERIADHATNVAEAGATGVTP
jgi:PhoU domain